MNNFSSRALGAGALTAFAVLASTGIASAHVAVSAPDAAQGGYTVLSFRVPTESDAASTTSVKIELPDLTSARTEPMPGWTSVVDKSADGKATAVTWTVAPGNTGVGPGQFQQFVLSAGPLPEADSVSFPAAQTYSDGEVVNWDQPTPEDGTEPELPAPTLQLAEGSDDDHGSPTVAAASSETTTSTTAAATSSSDT
ncbi:MAG: YcnI family protein, partial [Rhodococcus sp. (in: high G+C Gram-positive bacteria)]